MFIQLHLKKFSWACNWETVRNINKILGMKKNYAQMLEVEPQTYRPECNNALNQYTIAVLKCADLYFAVAVSDSLCQFSKLFLEHQRPIKKQGSYSFVRRNF